MYKSFKNLFGYFTKNTLPYWCILIFDSLIVFASGLLVFWLVLRTDDLFNYRVRVIHTLLLYVAAALVSFRVFRPYRGIIRYSSFIDLLKVAYANILAFALSLTMQLLTPYMGLEIFFLFIFPMPLLTFALSTMLMWGMRMLVKEFYDLISSEGRPLRVMIYGIQDGGVALAKMIRTQETARSFRTTAS